MTRSGWGALAVGSLFLLTGRVLALLEISIIGVALLGLLVASVLSSFRRPPRVDVTRYIQPSRVHVGDEAETILDIVNTGSRTTPILRFDDRVESTGGASIRLAPQAAGDRSRAAYRLPTARRGMLRVGPLTVSHGDPFGLTRRHREMLGTDTLAILPRIDELTRLPATSGHDPLSGRDHRHRLGDVGDDIYALRPYVPGDDLRRVSWRASARRDELIVRQDELPWQRRTTVLLDTRSETMEESIFERAVSAAASIVHRQQDDLVRLVATDGYDTGFVAGHLAIDAIMDYLAVVDPSPHRSLRGLTERLARSKGGGTLIMIARLRPEDLDLPSRLRPRFGSVRPVVFVAPGDRNDDLAADPDAVIVEPFGSFASAWDGAIRAAEARTARLPDVPLR